MAEEEEDTGDARYAPQSKAVPQSSVPPPPVNPTFSRPSSSAPPSPNQTADRTVQLSGVGAHGSVGNLGPQVAAIPSASPPPLVAELDVLEEDDTMVSTVMSTGGPVPSESTTGGPSEGSPTPDVGLASNVQVKASVTAQLDPVRVEAAATLGPKPFQVVHPSNDDPWATKLVDELGVEGDARAFARLAIAKAFSPPLAVGIFGAWGSGKSFFMRLIYDHIARLKAGVPTAEAPEANPSVFHSGVVQIRFNAWHYAETNLWASLVDHIFSELAKALPDSNKQPSLLDRLGTARDLTMEAAQALVSSRREQSRAAEALQQAKAAHTKAQQAVGSNPSVYWRAFEVVFNDPDNAEAQKAKEELREAAKELGIERLEEEAGRSAEAWEQLASESRRGHLLLRGLVEKLASGRALILLCMLVFFGPPLVIFLMHYIAKHVPALEDFREGVATATVLMASVTSVMSWAVVKVRAALSKLEAAKAAVDKEVDARLSSFKLDEGKRQAELESASARVAEAGAVLEASTKRYVDASNEFFGSSAGARLVRFVRSRATDGHYAQHLGLIASIRKDFETLSEQLREVEEGKSVEDPGQKAFEARIVSLIDDNKDILQEAEKVALRNAVKKPQQEEVPFKRVILYIDDLDRCPADKVVEVLQAVHMLLAFRLFVAFVAVDVRWIAQSLQKQYPELMISDDGPSTRRASPSDYLEKIFQIPYWIPEVGAEQGGKYLRSLFPDVFSTGAPPPVPQTSSTVLPINAVAFSLSESEVLFLEEFVPFVGGSPRKVLRLVNVYRLIKASGLLGEELGDHMQSERSLVLQLTLATAGPDEFHKWIEIIQTIGNDWGMTDVEEELKRRLEDKTFHDQRYLAALKKFGATGDYKSEALQKIRKYAGIAKRYSFAR